MRKIERLLIAAGVIFFASYIIHLPMCNQDYLRKSFIRLAEDMCKHSTLSQSIKHERDCRNHRTSSKTELYMCESKGYI